MSLAIVKPVMNFTLGVQTRLKTDIVFVIVKQLKFSLRISPAKFTPAIKFTSDLYTLIQRCHAISQTNCTDDSTQTSISSANLCGDFRQGRIPYKYLFW